MTRTIDASRIYYDHNDNVIVADYSELELDRDMMLDALQQILEITKRLSNKVYVLGCFRNTKMDAQLGLEFGEMTAQLLQHVCGIVRYEATVPYTNIAIRSQTVQHQLQKTQSHIYPSKELALAAIRQLEKS